MYGQLKYHEFADNTVAHKHLPEQSYQLLPNAFSVPIFCMIYLLKPCFFLSVLEREREGDSVTTNNSLLKAFTNSKVGPAEDIRAFILFKGSLTLPCTGSLGILLSNVITSRVFFMMNDENIGLALPSGLCDVKRAGQGSWEHP